LTDSKRNQEKKYSVTSNVVHKVLGRVSVPPAESGELVRNRKVTGVMGVMETVLFSV